MENALREWEEETGLSRDRLKILEECGDFDEVFLGCRYFLSECRILNSSQRVELDDAAGAGEFSWTPGDSDRNGIVRAH